MKIFSISPTFSFLQGSPYRQVNLHAVNVHLADLVIILSPPNMKMIPGLAEVEKPIMADREVIMVTMNLRGKQNIIVQLFLCFRNKLFGR